MPRVIGSAVGCGTASALVTAAAASSPRRPLPLTLLTTPTSASPSQLSTTQSRAIANIASPRTQVSSARAIDEPQPSSWALEQQARANERASQRSSQAATQLPGNSDDEADESAAGSAPMDDLPDAAASDFHPPSHQLSPPPLVAFKSAISGSALPLPLPVVDEQEEEEEEESRDKLNESKYDSQEPQSKHTSSNSSSDRSGSRTSGSGSSNSGDGRQSDPSMLTGSHFGSNSLSQSGNFGDIQFSQIDTMDDGSQPLHSDSNVPAAAAAARSASAVTTQMSLTLSTSQAMANELSGTPPLTQVQPPQPTRTIGGAAAQLHAQQQRRAFYKQPVAKSLLSVNRKRTLPPAPIFTDSPPTPRQPEPKGTPQTQRPVQPIQKEAERKVAEAAHPPKPPTSVAARQFDALFSSSQPTPSSRGHSALTQAAAGVGATAVPAQQSAQALPKQLVQAQQRSPSVASDSTSTSSGVSAAPLPRKREIDPGARANARHQREDRYRELYPLIKGDVEAARDLTNCDLVAVLCGQGLKNVTNLKKETLIAMLLPFVVEDKLALPVVRAAGAAKATSSQSAATSASKKLPNLALYATQPMHDSDDEGQPASLSQGNKRHKATHASSQEHAVFEQQPTEKSQQKPKPAQHAAASAPDAATASAAAPVSRSSALQPWIAPPLIFRDAKYLRPPCTDFPPYSPCSFILHAGSEVVVVAAEYLRFRVQHMFAINQLAALQSQQESQQRFVKARHTINSLAIPTGLVHAKVLSFYPIISEELSKRKPLHSGGGGGAACRGWNHPPPSPWCELTLQITEGEFAGEQFTLFYIDSGWILPHDAPSERRQLTVQNCAPFLLDKTRYDQLRSHDWSVGELFQMPLVSCSTQSTEQVGDESMAGVAAAPSAANLVLVMRVGRIISIKPVFPPHIDPMNFSQSPYHALKVLWLTKQAEEEKFVYDAWNQDISCVSFWEIWPHSTASDQLATCMAPIAFPAVNEQGFKATVRRHITKILEDIYELGWRPLWLRQPQSSQVHLFSSLMTTPVSAFVAVRQQFIEICENHHRGYYSDWSAILPELLSLLRGLNDLEHEYGCASSVSASYPGLVSIGDEAPLPLDVAQLDANLQTEVLQARMVAESRVEEEWSEQCPQAMGAIVAAISKLIHARIAVEPAWTERFSAMHISEPGTNGTAVSSDGSSATRIRDRHYTKLSQLMVSQK